MLELKMGCVLTGGKACWENAQLWSRMVPTWCVQTPLQRLFKPLSFGLAFNTLRFSGFAVVPALSLDYWQEGKPPRSQRVEYPTLAVPGRRLWPQCRSYLGLCNEVEPRPNFRGSMTVRCGASTTYKSISFWNAFVAGSLKKVKPPWW